jgi:ABC-type glycerol-3-phosphate transport system permease component
VAITSSFIAFEGQYWGALAAGGVLLIVLPLLICAIYAQNSIVGGLLRGAVKLRTGQHFPLGAEGAARR